MVQKAKEVWGYAQHITPVLMAFMLSGLIYEIRSQAIQDQRLEVVTSNQKAVMEELKSLVAEVESSSTPLSKRVETMDGRLALVQERVLKLENKLESFMELESQRHSMQQQKK